MRFLLICAFILGSNAFIYNRKINVVYVQNPEETEEAMHQRMADRFVWMIDGMNEAADFHELPFRFTEGALIKESTEYWTDAQLECGDALNGLCADLANKHGRQTDYLELWVCIFKTQYFRGCQGVAKTTGNLALVGEQAFFKDDKIGVFHELGHNLGCGHMSQYCPADVDEFVTVNKKLYKTLMGGGGGCNDAYNWKAEGIEKIRALLFTDSTKKYCENGVCQSLGDEEFDCVSQIREFWERRLRKWTPECGSLDEYAKMQPICTIAKDMTCTDSKRMGKFGAKLGECAARVKENPDKCPTGMFYYKDNRNACFCCKSSDFESADGQKVLISQDPIFPEETFSQTFSETFSFEMLNNYEPLMSLLAVIGVIGSLYWLGKYIIALSEKYETVPDMDDV